MGLNLLATAQQSGYKAVLEPLPADCHLPRGWSQPGHTESCCQHLCEGFTAEDQGLVWDTATAVL